MGGGWLEGGSVSILLGLKFSECLHKGVSVKKSGAKISSMLRGRLQTLAASNLVVCNAKQEGYCQRREGLSNSGVREEGVGGGGGRGNHKGFRLSRNQPFDQLRLRFRHQEDVDCLWQQLSHRPCTLEG
jgi:hypothetical protein